MGHFDGSLWRVLQCMSSAGPIQPNNKTKTTRRIYWIYQIYQVYQIYPIGCASFWIYSGTRSGRDPSHIGPDGHQSPICCFSAGGIDVLKMQRNNIKPVCRSFGRIWSGASQRYVLKQSSPLQPEGDDVRLQAWVKPGSWWSDPSEHLLRPSSSKPPF